MKKIFKFMPLVVIALCSMMIVACGDDDDDNGGNDPKDPTTAMISSAAIKFNCSDNFADYFDVYLSINGGAEQKVTNLKQTFIVDPPTSLPATIKFEGRVVRKDGVDFDNISEASVEFDAATANISGVYNAATKEWSNLNMQISSSSLKFSLPNTSEKIDKYLTTCSNRLNKTIEIKK